MTTSRTSTSLAQPLIELRSLSKTFYRGSEVIRAIDSLSLTIDAGDFVAITGASGSGKSTLMYILGLLDKQTAGEYRLQGRPIEEVSDDQRAAIRNGQFGFVFQGFHLIPRATALRNVAMPLEYATSSGTRLSRRAIEARAKEALERVGLTDRLHHLPNELSGGQRQRVAIARALVNNPSVILADEPTGNLDSRNANEIIKLFHTLNSDGRSIVLVTHDPTLANQAKRRISMFDGKVVEDLRYEA